MFEIDLFDKVKNVVLTHVVKSSVKNGQHEKLEKGSNTDLVSDKFLDLVVKCINHANEDDLDNLLHTGIELNRLLRRHGINSINFNSRFNIEFDAKEYKHVFSFSFYRTNNGEKEHALKIANMLTEIKGNLAILSLK